MDAEVQAFGEGARQLVGISEGDEIRWVGKVLTGFSCSYRHAC